jgi:hypothetical protein
MSNYVRQISEYPNVLSKSYGNLMINKDFFFFNYEIRKCFTLQNGFKREVQSFQYRRSVTALAVPTSQYLCYLLLDLEQFIASVSSL